MRIGYDVAARDAKTPQQYIAAQIALCLEQTGELPTMDDMHAAYIMELDEEWRDRFGSGAGKWVTEDHIYRWLFDILKEAMV